MRSLSFSTRVPSASPVVPPSPVRVYIFDNRCPTSRPSPVNVWSRNAILLYVRSDNVVTKDTRQWRESTQHPEHVRKNRPKWLSGALRSPVLQDVCTECSLHSGTGLSIMTFVCTSLPPHSRSHTARTREIMPRICSPYLGNDSRQCFLAQPAAGHFLARVSPPES